MAKIPFTVTIYYNPNGSLNGAVVQYRMTDDNGVFPPKTLDPQDLTLDGNDAMALPTVLGDALSAALDANTALRATTTAQAGQISALQDQVNSLQHFSS